MKHKPAGFFFQAPLLDPEFDEIDSEWPLVRGGRLDRADRFYTDADYTELERAKAKRAYQRKKERKQCK